MAPKKLKRVPPLDSAKHWPTLGQNVSSQRTSSSKAGQTASSAQTTSFKKAEQQSTGALMIKTEDTEAVDTTNAHSHSDMAAQQTDSPTTPITEGPDAEQGATPGSGKKTRRGRRGGRKKSRGVSLSDFILPADLAAADANANDDGGAGKGSCNGGDYDT